MSIWWTDEKIEATINRPFVCSHLTREEQEKLDRQLCFGDALTDNTYLDWILTKARRLFLILVDIGVPDQIFYIVDESYDDDDLPVAAESVRNLRLTYEKDTILERKFFRTQFQYLVRGVKEGDHIRYGNEEAVPVEVIGHKPGIPNIARDGMDKVVLPGSRTRVLLRKRVMLNEDPTLITEDEVLTEVNSMKQYRHDHLVSIFASYVFERTCYVLMQPSTEWTLKSFLTDPPQSFKSLEKRERREILIKWPHCLASALMFLHSHMRHHGSIRPSNVFVDSHYRIFFGYLDIYRLIKPDVKGKDVEAYEYAAPERWIRAAAVQTTTQSRTMLHSGGRTARKMQRSTTSSSSAPSSATSKSQRSSYSSEGSSLSPPVTGTSTSFFTTARKSPSLISFETLRPSTAKTSKTSTSYPSSVTSSHSSGTTGRTKSKSPKQPLNYTPSITSSHSSGATTRPTGNLTNPVAVPSPQLHSAIISTWQSQQYDPFPADVFAFGAITLEILTHFCKRKLSSFAWHRSCKNRTAGRGGAPADASYHANLKQLVSWIKALKKIAFDKDDELFRAAERMLDLCGKILVKDPETRPSSRTVEKEFADALAFAHCKPHCVKPIVEDPVVEQRPTTAVRRSIDNPKATLKRGGVVTNNNQSHPPVPPLPPKLKQLLGEQSAPIPPPPLQPPPPITDVHDDHNASSSSLASSAFSFETSGFRWDDHEDEEEDSPHSDIIELPRQDSMAAIPELNFPPPLRHSSIINAGMSKLDIGTANGGEQSHSHFQSQQQSPGLRLTRTRSPPQSANPLTRNWPLPSADEIDEVLTVRQ